MIPQSERPKYNQLPSSVYSLPGIKVHNYCEHDLIKDVCDYFKITPDKIKEKRRIGTIVRPRQICMFLLIEKFSKRYTFEGIGYMMGGFNHATVTHSRDAVEKDMETNAAYRDMIEEIRTIVNSHMLEKEKIKD